MAKEAVPGDPRGRHPGPDPELDLPVLAEEDFVNPEVTDPALRDRIAKVARRASRFRVTPHLAKAMKKFLKEAGISEKEWEEIIEADPAAAEEIRRKIIRKFEFGLLMVYDRILAAAEDGNTSAMKLYLQRFDKDYTERKETRRVDEMGEPEYADFVHAMRLRLGERRWNMLQDAAERAGLVGGVFGEKYLPGGPLAEEKVIDAEVLDDDPFGFEEE